MAKKSSSGNKSAAIREALQSNPDKGPKEIAEIVQTQGFRVNAQYVSIIKSNLKKSAGESGRKVRVKRAGGKIPGHGVGNKLGPIDAAVQFVRACGGLDQAKAVLAQVEAIRAVV
ncbi:hypothetical protein Pan44_53220 [Caulifigura coniformis]|uniref:Uncharacterized protein n=1 Tax=Caulifigura coniformis TaxID=2527983 RepID=A0A517SM98_9PLAN|nr:hypothetical protein [Caulifigura coniformis]QDT57254.1 hypothetical protein Pan44_53220 [Caulifigura coniformis]